MDRLLRGIVVAIGSLLGIIRTGDPTLSLRVFRDSQAIYLNMEVVNAFPREARQLLEAGNALSVVFAVDATAHPSVRLVHGIAYSPITERYTVRLQETGMLHETSNVDVAIQIASRVYGLALMECAQFDDRRSLDVAVSCSLEVPGMDASVVWNYRSPSARVSYRALSEIPQ